MKDLILIGGGGHCKSVIDVALTSNIKINGILDPHLSTNSNILNIPILGSDDLIGRYSDEFTFSITIGSIKNTNVRRAIYSKIMRFKGELATILSSKAHISTYSEIGNGTSVMHHSVINSDSKIGLNCIINTGSIIEHDVIISDFVHVSTGAIINGNCSLGENVFIGSNSTIKQGTKICNDVIIGAQSYVNKDITEPGIYVGVPIKKIKYAK